MSYSASVLRIVLVGCLTIVTVARNGIYESTATLWKSVVERVPDKVRPRQNYAHALVQEGNRTGDARFYWQALEELNAVHSRPGKGPAEMRSLYGETGMAYYSLGMPDEAIRVWKEGLERFPADAQMESNIAFALTDAGRYDEALPHALASRRADPALPEAANTLGILYLNRGEYRLAADQFLQFCQLRPEESHGLWNAALAYERAGDLPRARDLAQQYLAREIGPQQRAEAEAFVRDLGTRLEHQRRGH